MNEDDRQRLIEYLEADQLNSDTSRPLPRAHLGRGAQLGLWGLRIFDAPNEGGAEASCSDLGAPLLVISQFTLYGDTRKGRRPSWLAAAPGPVAEPLVDEVVAALRRLGAQVETGRFGADMKVSLVNDGPVTLILEV